MKSNTVLFEGVVMDAYQSDITDPPSEVVYINYPLDPCDIIGISYNEETGEVEEKRVGVNDKGWIQIHLPTFKGLKAGDKIQIIKNEC
jgi:uncharacterized membrane protein